MDADVLGWDEASRNDLEEEDEVRAITLLNRGGVEGTLQNKDDEACQDTL